MWDTGKVSGALIYIHYTPLGADFNISAGNLYFFNRYAGIICGWEKEK